MNKPQPNREDSDIWQEFVREVSPIDKKQVVTKVSKKLIIKNNIKEQEANSLINLSSDIARDLDKNTAQKFKQGKFPIEARLDLHGYTEKNAWEAVRDFIKRSYINQKRCILIITGKGNRIYKNDASLLQKGILKEQLPKWLNNSELKGLILAYSQALPKDGGSGAFYILLRRQRD